MKFNQYLWGIYKNSEQGVAAINLFEKGGYEELLVAYGNKDEKAYKYIKDFFENASFSVFTKDINKNSATDLFESIIEEGILFNGVESYEESYEIFEVDVILNLVPILSICLFRKSSTYFKPYLFKGKFDQLVAIADSFEMELPDVPLKKNKKERILYYVQLVEVFQRFQDSNSLTPYELCAFLYDFAPKYLANIAEGKTDLPQPTQVWLVGGDKGGRDFEFLDNPTPGVSHFWQGNVDTKRGDIIIVYCLAPRSCIHSIWRATADGIADPLFHYYSNIYIGEGLKVKPIHLSELKSDPYFSSHPLVRKNLQGVSGYPFTSSDYNSILSILKKKGQDLSQLPQIYFHSFDVNTNLSTERDVEMKLIEPLIERLGYDEKDWVRQLGLRMGRGERNYPDYAFVKKREKGFDTAHMIIEAKYLIKNNRELEETFKQTWSYGLRLEAKTLVIADKEAIWIYRKQNESFDRTKYLKKYWRELENADEFRKVLSIIGKRN